MCALFITAPANCTCEIKRDVRKNEWPYELSEVNGQWSSARRVGEIGGITGYAFSALSCVNVQNCVADGSINGFYSVRAVETAGVWGRASNYNVIAPNHSIYANELNAVACTTSGYCVIGGNYDTSRAGVDNGIPGHSSAYVTAVHL